MTRSQTCTQHCGTCRRHFSGLGAFDAHRRDGECVSPEVVVDRDGKLLLQVWTTEGKCVLEKGCYRDGKLVRASEPVTIWQRAVTEEQRARMQAAFALREES